MASRSQVVTDTPTPLANTVDDTEYVVQNLGATPVSVLVAAAEPDAGTAAFSCQPLEFLYPKHGAGESIYVWRAAGIGRAVVAYEEVH